MRFDCQIFGLQNMISNVYVMFLDCLYKKTLNRVAVLSLDAYIIFFAYFIRISTYHIDRFTAAISRKHKSICKDLY